MKKLITLALAILSSITSIIAANNVDIIIKTNSEKIEALIQEVSAKEIRYKKANNPNGPMFVIDLEEVSAILYSNGETQSIDHQPKQQPANNVYRAYNNYGYASGPMQHIGNNTYTIGGKTLQGRELKYFLQQNCPSAYNYYKTCSNIETAGWVLLPTGTVMCLVMGLSMLACATEYYSGSYYYNYAMGDAGLSFLIIGAVTAGLSVPLIACGNVYKKRVDQVFNTQCGNRNVADLRLNLISNNNGLGLALSF